MLVLALVVTWGTDAGAWEAQSAGDEGKAQTPGGDAGARALFDDALTHFRAGRYREAIAGFQAAYERSKEPVLLFDIAQAHRLSGDCPNAVAAYKAYLEAAPSAENRSKVEARLRELDGQCGVRPAANEPPRKPAHAMDGTVPADVIKPVPPPEPVGSPDHHPQTWRRNTALALGGGALISAALGAAFTWKAKTSADQTSTLFRGGGDWDNGAMANDLSGRHAATWGTIGFVGTAILSAAALAILAVGRGSEPGRSSAEGNSRQ